MRKIFVIAVREYLAAVKTRSFLISLLVLPLLMGGSVLVQAVVRDHVDLREKHFAIIDRSPGERLAQLLEEAAGVRNEKHIFDEQGNQIKPVFRVERIAPSEPQPDSMLAQRVELSDRVRRNELFGFLEIGADVLSYRQNIGKPPIESLENPFAASSSAGLDDRFVIRYQTNTPTYEAFERWARKVLSDAVESRRLAEAHFSMPPEELKALLQPVPLNAKGLSKRDPATGQFVDAQDENQVASMLAPAGLMVLMFLLILIGATPLMQGVVEEKALRIAEVLLGSVRPFQLMMGKLVGMVAVSLTLSLIYLGAAYWAAHRYGLDQFLPTEVLVWFLIYLTLAVFMFGSLFIAVGAACTDMRETQSMLWPVMLLVTFPMFVWIQVVREPSSSFSTGISFIPFATPMLMLVRQSVPPGVPSWQPILAVGMVILTTLACVYAAGRIFRVGILMQGKGAHLGDLFRWVFRG